MTDSHKQIAENRWGKVVIEVDDGPPLPRVPGGSTSTSSKYVWRPSAEVSTHLPESFTFSLRCVRAPDGLRRFYPTLSPEDHINLAFVAGLAILAVRENLTPHHRHSYRAMYDFFRRLRQTREHRENNLLSARSLQHSRIGQDNVRVRSILPEDVGLDSRGEGQPWSVDVLLREGRDLARTVGVSNPSEAQCVHYGLVAAAERNPLWVSDEESLPLVRMALYESIPEEVELDQELRGHVIERALLAVHDHLEDSAADFQAWFAGPRNSFVQQIAKRKRLPGGKLDRNVVRAALLEVGWDAYQYVAGCIHTVMRVIQRSLPDPLTDAERQRFEHMHLAQPYLGGLPLVLLLERFPLLHSVLWDIWENSTDRHPVAVLHRLLAWYAEMASTRRAADRTIQARRASPKPSGQARLSVPLDRVLAAQEQEAEDEEAEDESVSGKEAGHEGLRSEVSPTSGADADRLVTQEGAGHEDLPSERPITPGAGVPLLFMQIATVVREHRGVRCACTVPDWVDRVIQQDENQVTLSHGCTVCGLTAESTLSVPEIQALAQRAIEE